eukprot:1181740-Prorocentrum_minimum.AAC.1
MSDLKNRLLERVGQLQQDADSAISYKEFGTPSEQDNETLKQLYAVKRDVFKAACLLYTITKEYHKFTRESIRSGIQS